MDNPPLLDKVHDLSDLELAILLSLISAQHATIQTDHGSLDDLTQELMLASSNTFGLSATSYQCTSTTTPDDLSQSILQEDSSLQGSLDCFHQSSMTIPNVVIVRDLQQSNHQVQMQVLELLRTKRIFTHTAVYTTPRHFLILVVSSVGSRPLVNHLRDHIFFSHIHDLDDGFPNLRETAEAGPSASGTLNPLFEPSELEHLSGLIGKVTITTEVIRYIHDIVIFLRMHRAVASGTTPLATKHFVSMTKSLAPLHGLTYVSPSIVTLAARKVFPHRLVLVTPATERSMQYGSDVAAVAALLEGMTPESVVEDVLNSVDCPL